jgi:hypothetical protein
MVFCVKAQASVEALLAPEKEGKAVPLLYLLKTVGHHACRTGGFRHERSQGSTPENQSHLVSLLAGVRYYPINNWLVISVALFLKASGVSAIRVTALLPKIYKRRELTGSKSTAKETYVSRQASIVNFRKSIQ